MRQEERDFFNRIREARDVDMLIRILENDNPPWMKRDVITILGQIGDPKAIPALLLHLQKSGSSYRNQISNTILRSLVQIGWHGVDHLIRILLTTPFDKEGPIHTNDLILIITCQALGRIGDVRAVESLGKIISSPAGCPFSVANSALIALGEIGSPDAIDSIRVYIDSRDVSVTAKGDEILVKIGDERAVAVIQHQISRIVQYSKANPDRAGDMKERLNVLTEAIEGIRSGTARPVIEERESFRQLARETEEWIRKAQTLREGAGSTGWNPLAAYQYKKEEENRIQLMIEGLLNNDREIFFQASRILVLFGTPAVEPVLAVAPRFPFPVLPFRYPFGVIKSIAELLGLIGKPAVPALIRSIEGREPVTGLIAISALGMIGDTMAVDPLLHVLTHSPDPDFRSAAASALGEIADPRVKPYLLTALQDPDEDVRTAACKGLGHFRDATLIGTFLSILADTGCRQYAKQGLIDIGEPVLRPVLEYYRQCDRMMQKEVLGVIGGMDDPVSLPMMVEILRDNDKAVRDSARNAIFHQLPSDERIPLLLEALEREKKMRIRKDIQTTIDIIRMNRPAGSA